MNKKDVLLVIAVMISSSIIYGVTESIEQTLTYVSASIVIYLVSRLVLNPKYQVRSE